MTTLDRKRISRMIALSRKCIAAVRAHDWDVHSRADSERTRIYLKLSPAATAEYLRRARAAGRISHGVIDGQN